MGMGSMRIAICDDDTIFSARLEQWVREYFEINELHPPDIVIYEFGEDVLRDPGDLDIIFLDVELPGLSGIFTGQDLMRKYPRLLVFIITAFPEYLDEAMRFNAFRYLSKPLDKNRLYRDMQDAIKIQTNANAKIIIETKTETITVYMKDIICIEAKEHKVIVHTTKKDYVAIRHMPYWVEHLDTKSFYQTHRNYIVNLEYVVRFDETTIYLYNDELTAYLTKRKHREFKQAYLLYLEGQGR